MSNAGHTEGAGHGHGVEAPHVHVLPLGLYWGVLGTLLVLTLVTVGIAKVDLGPFNLIVAMTVASIKASLVLAVFMHLWWDSKINLIIFVTSLLFLSLFIVLTMLDTEGRDLIDPVRANFLPRDEAVLMHEEKMPDSGDLRPGEPFGATKGAENYKAFKTEHGEHGAAGATPPDAAHDAKAPAATHDAKAPQVKPAEVAKPAAPAPAAAAPAAAAPAAAAPAAAGAAAPAPAAPAPAAGQPAAPAPAVPPPAPLPAAPPSPDGAAAH